MKKISLFTFFVVLILNIFLGVNNSFWLEDEWLWKIKKISDIENDIKYLKADKKHSKFVFDNFMKENWKVKGFLKKDITKDDLSKIFSKIKEYESLKLKYDENIEMNKEDLFSLRKRFYDFLSDYIEESKMSSFDSFVSKDLERIKKEYHIDSNIEESNNVLNEKVTSIKGKILENQIKLNSKLENVLENKIRLKFLIFKNSKKISAIPVGRKKKIFNSVLVRIQNKIKVIDAEKNIKKMRTYKIVEKILLENIDDLNKKLILD